MENGGMDYVKADKKAYQMFKNASDNNQTIDLQTAISQIRPIKEMHSKYDAFN